MFGIGVFEMLIAVPILLLFVAGIVVLILLGLKGLRGVRMGHAMLNCPHCHAETPAGDGQCRHCGKPFS